MEPDQKFAEKYKDEFVSYIFQQGQTASKAALDYAVFNLKLVSTLSAGAVVLLVTIIGNIDASHHADMKILSSFLPHYMLILFISFCNSLAMYIYGEWAVEESHFQINELDKLVAGQPHVSEGPKAKLIERLAAAMLGIHIVSGLYFFIVSFVLACNLKNLALH